MDETGLDVTKVLPVEEPEVELTEVIDAPMSKEAKEQLFYSCLRGYGWKG
jgi:hypothetical protein